MLENGKMGLLRRVFKAILGHNVINRHFSDVICRLFATIRGHRPANLVTKHSLFTVSLPDVIRQSRSTGRSPWMTIKKSMLSQDTCNKFGNDRRLLQSGRSMIEMLGVLAIIAVLSVGGISGYSKAMEKWKIDKTIDYLTQIATNVQTLYMQQKSYEGLSDSTALQAGVYPENNWKLPLGENTSVLLRDSEDGTLFGLRICGLTARQCLALTTQQWGGNANGLYGVSIVLAHNFLNGAAGIKQTGQGCSGKIEINGAYFACAEGGNNIISFDMANKYCNRLQQDGTVCMGLFFR